MFDGKCDPKLYIGDKDDKENYGKIVKRKNKFLIII